MDEIVVLAVMTIPSLLNTCLLIQFVHKLFEDGDGCFLDQKRIWLGGLSQDVGEQVLLQEEGWMAEGVGEREGVSRPLPYGRSMAATTKSG